MAWSSAAAESVLEQLRAHPFGKEAALVGEVVERKGVRLTGLYGVKRTLDLAARGTFTPHLLEPRQKRSALTFSFLPVSIGKQYAVYTDERSWTAGPV